MTQLDHQANVAPWRALERERGIGVRLVHFDPVSGELDMEEMARSINSHTKLVAIGAASNALGTINDIPRITGMAHAAGALAFVDAVHYAAHGLMDVRAWDCDLAVCSAYKLYGPHIGVLYGRRDLLAGLDVPKVDPAPDEPPERIETGTQNHEGIAGAGAAVDFLASLSPAGPGHDGAADAARGGVRDVAPAGRGAGHAALGRVVGHPVGPIVRPASGAAEDTDRGVYGAGPARRGRWRNTWRERRYSYHMVTFTHRP